MGEPGTTGLPDGADLDAAATDGTSHATPPQAETSSDAVPSPTETPAVAASEQGVNQEAVSAQDVGAALIAENRRLGGKMGLVIVPTTTGYQSEATSTTVLFSALRRDSVYGREEYRAYGVNSETGLVYYADATNPSDKDVWDKFKLKLPKDVPLTGALLKPIKTPKDMEDWTAVVNQERHRAEISVSMEAAQTEYERSLPKKAMEAIQAPLAPTQSTPPASAA